MYKAKLCGLAIACMLWLIGVNPTISFAAETGNESRAPSEINIDHEEKKTAFEGNTKVASDKWNTLTEIQKDIVYALLENKIQIESKLMDTLVEYGVMEKADAVIMKAHMAEKFNRVKRNDEFPLLGK